MYQDHKPKPKTQTKESVSRPSGDSLMGHARQKDLLALTCALLSNPEVYPARNSVNVVVELADHALEIIEQRGKQK